MATRAQIELTATDRTRQAFAQVERNFSGLQRSADGFNRVMAGIGGALSVGAMVGFARSIVDSADSLQKLSQRTGQTVEDLVGLQHAFELSGIDGDQLEMALRKLNVRLAELGDKRTAKQALLDLADEFQRMPDGAEKTARAVDIFGERIGDKMIPALNGGREALAQMIDEGQRLTPITSEMAKQAEIFNDNITRLATSLRGAFVPAINSVLPQLNLMIEQFQEGTRIAGGFANAIRLFGVQQSPGRAVENIRSLQQEIAKLEKTPGLLVPGLGKDEKLADLRKRLEFEKFRQSQDALGLLSGVDLSVEARRLGGDRGSFDAGLRKLTEQKAKIAKAAAERFPPEGRFPQLVTGVESIASIEADLLLDQSEAVAKLVERYSDLADPLEKYRKELAEIQRLQESGALTGEKAAAASAAVTEQMTREMERLKKQVEETDKLGKELGMTFASAFEDAIVGGKDFGDVLKGLAQDVARLFLRETVTAPLAGALSGVFKGFSLGSLIPKFAEGTDFVPRDMLAVVHRGEAIIPAAMNRGGGDVTLVQNISMDNRGADAGVDARIRAGMARARDEAVAAVKALSDRGGAYARAVGRR